MQRILKIAILAVSALAGSHAYAQDYKDVWNDVRKPWRANSELDAAIAEDSSACEAMAGPQYGRPSAAFTRCMGSKHWKLARVIRLPAQSASEPSDDTTPIDNGTRRPDDVFPDSPVELDEAPPAPDIHPFCPNPIC
jgi:hypothetical protein